jgi:hypothetical protein
VDEEPDPREVSGVLQVHEQVADGLRNPGMCGVRGGAENADAPASVVDGGEDVWRCPVRVTVSMKSIARIASAWERRKSAHVTVVRCGAGSTPSVLRTSHTGYFDFRHDHRWSYVGAILRGGCRHYLFGDVTLNDSVESGELQRSRGPARAGRELLCLPPHDGPRCGRRAAQRVTRYPRAGGRDRFPVMNRKVGESWRQYGTRQKSTVEAVKKRMGKH